MTLPLSDPKLFRHRYFYELWQEDYFFNIEVSLRTKNKIFIRPFLKKRQK